MARINRKRRVVVYGSESEYSYLGVSDGGQDVWQLKAAPRVILTENELSELLSDGRAYQPYSDVHALGVNLAISNIVGLYMSSAPPHRPPDEYVTIPANGQVLSDGSLGYFPTSRLRDPSHFHDELQKLEKVGLVYRRLRGDLRAVKSTTSLHAKWRDAQMAATAKSMEVGIIWTLHELDHEEW